MATCDYTDKVVLITGAASGFGRLAAGVFAGAGALLALADLDLEALNATVSDAFIASRLGHGGRVYGTLPRGIDVAALLARSTPQPD